MAEKENKTINTKVKKDLEGLSERAKKSQLRVEDLIIPISSFIILLILSLFVFFPMINTAIKYRSEIKEINEKLETLDKLEDSISEIDDTKLLSDLVIAKKIIPKRLQVSDFVFYIDTLARERSLTTREISAGDISVGGDKTEVKGSLGVSGPLSYSGPYTEILKFLDEIQADSPYLVTLRNIAMTNAGEGNWRVEFQLTGYYIPEEERRFDYYQPFTKYTNFSEVIDIFSVRVNRLDE